MDIYKNIKNRISLVNDIDDLIKTSCRDRKFYCIFFKYYFMPFLAIILLSEILVRLEYWESNLGSAQYLVSTVLQAEATILAIVVSLTIFVVQNAQSYSPRIINFFGKPNKNPHFWSLIALYIFALSYGIFVLKALNGVEPDKFSNLQQSLWIISLLAIQSFYSLKFYIIHTLKMLEPNELVDQIVNDIHVDIFLNPKPRTFKDGNHENELQVQNNLMLSLTDLIQKAIISHDNYTSLYAIERFSGHIKSEIIATKSDFLEYKNFLSMYNTVLTNLLEFSINNHNSSCASSVNRAIISLGIAILHKTKDVNVLKTQSSFVFGSLKYTLNITGNDQVASEILLILFSEFPEIANLDNSEIKKYVVSSIGEIGLSAMGMKKIQTGHASMKLIIDFANYMSENKKDNIIDECEEQIQTIIDEAFTQKQFPMLLEFSQELKKSNLRIKLEIEKINHRSYKYNNVLYSI